MISKTIKIKFGKQVKEYKVFCEPLPHILVDSKKEMHGWWPGKRECTGERMLVNPYNGCTHNCFFCYAHALWGYFYIFETEGVVTVFKDFDKVVAGQLDKVDYASCGYLSPVTDPFQPLNNKYKLTEKIIAEFVNRNIPVEFITKGRVSDEAILLIAKQKHSFGQISILTMDEELRKKIVPGGVSTDVLLDNIKRLKAKNIFTVVRIDPISPYITDHAKDLEKLIKTVSDLGAKHIITSCVDIPGKFGKKFKSWLQNNFGEKMVKKYQELFSERIDGDSNAVINYRRELFRVVRKLCDKNNITMALCMEYEKINKVLPKGLNSEFMSSKNCEGINIPMYKYSGVEKNGYRQFKPLPCGNDGNCLTCVDPVCGVRELAMGKCYDCNRKCKIDFKLSDYKRWSKDNKKQISFF
ncbi:radical SAM protein [Candidatus Parcubacteria bacterium]|nr:radical SAM protein [Candidatus Parcubacteria bacterium]